MLGAHRKTWVVYWIFLMPLSFLQTLSKGGESSLSGPQQYVAVQRPALPLQEGKMTRLLVHLNLGVLKTRLATRGFNGTVDFTASW